MRDLIKFLFETSQKEAVSEVRMEDFAAVMEEAEKEETIKVEATALSKALSKLGVKDVKVETDGAGAYICLPDAQTYAKVKEIVQDPENMYVLAGAGWVAAGCGDTSGSDEEPDFRIRFVDITVAKTGDSDKSDVETDEIVKLAREWAFSDGPDPEPSGDVEIEKPKKPKKGAK